MSENETRQRLVETLARLIAKHCAVPVKKSSTDEKKEALDNSEPSTSPLPRVVILEPTEEGDAEALAQCIATIARRIATTTEPSTQPPESEH